MLARAAWFRTGRHRGNPAFRKNDLYERIDEPLLGDVRFLLAGLARVARRDGVPVTVVLIPSYTQVVESSSYGFQDTLIALCREVGLDAFDPRQAFRRAAAPASLYVPDKHLSDDGNRLLLDELLEHVARSGAPPPRANETRGR